MRLLPSEHAEFRSPIAVHQAREALAASLKPSSLGAYLSDRVTGWVGEQDALLKVRGPWVSSALRPVFEGRWVEAAGEARLVGEFRLSYAVPSASVLLVGLLLITDLAISTSRAWQVVLGKRLAWAAAFGVVSYLTLWLGWKSGATDRQRIREHLGAVFAAAAA